MSPPVPFPGGKRGSGRGEEIERELRIHLVGERVGAEDKEAELEFAAKLLASLARLRTDDSFCDLELFR